MARLWSSGAELQSITDGIEWDTTSGSGVTIDTTTKRSGSASVKFVSSASASNYIEHQYSSSGVVTFSRAYVYFTAFPTDATGAIIQHINSTPAVMACIAITTAGKLRLYDGNSAGTQRGSDSAALSLNTWYRVELTTNNGAGTEIEAKLDGTAFASGAMTLATNAQQIDFGFADFQANGVMYMDDMAVNDNSGSSQTSWPGAGSIVHMNPDAAGDNTQWQDDASATQGTAIVGNINETTPDDATNYNKRTTNSPTTTPIDDWNCESSSTAGIGSSDTITLVAVGARIGATSNTAGTGRQINYRIKSASGGTTTSVTAIDISFNGWKSHKDPVANTYQLTSYTDPTTGSAWTPTGTNSLDNMQIGYQATASSTQEIRVSTIWALVEYVPVNDYSVNVSDSITLTESIGRLEESYINKSDSITLTESIGRLLESSVNRSENITVSESLLPRFSFSTFKDEFDTIDSAVWTKTEAGSATVTLADEIVTVNFPAASTSSTDGDLTSVRQYDLTGAAASLKVTAVPSALTNADAELRVGIDASNYIRWVYEAGTLYAQYNVAGIKTTAFSVAYSATTHLFWQIRESGGTIFWDTSTDGNSYTNRASVANPIAVNSLYAVLAGTCYQVEVAPGTFSFTDFNMNVGLITKSENITVSENVQVLLVSNVNVSDSSTITESVTMLETSMVNVSDSVTITEATQQALTPLFVNVSDSSTITESTNQLMTSFINVNDTATITENAIALIPTLLIAVSDTITTTENVLRTLVSLVSVSDSITLTENVALLETSFISVSDNIAVSEGTTVSIVAAGVDAIVVSDNITITENVIVLITTLFVNVNDSITVTEQVGVSIQGTSSTVLTRTLMGVGL